MNPERKDLLSVKTPPARLNAEETAWYLGFASHDILILVAAGLLKPLGRPPRASTKYFATATLEQLRSDVKWLARASDAIVGHWQKKNGRTPMEGCAKSQKRSRFKPTSSRLIPTSAHRSPDGVEVHSD